MSKKLMDQVGVSIDIKYKEFFEKMCKDEERAPGNTMRVLAHKGIEQILKERKNETE